jgi:hypothetical protein
VQVPGGNLEVSLADASSDIFKKIVFSIISFSPFIFVFAIII